MYKHFYHEQSSTHIHLPICVCEHYMTKVNPLFMQIFNHIFDAKYNKEKKIMIFASNFHDTSAEKY